MTTLHIWTTEARLVLGKWNRVSSPMEVAPDPGHFYHIHSWSNGKFNGHPRVQIQYAATRSEVLHSIPGNGRSSRHYM